MNARWSYVVYRLVFAVALLAAGILLRDVFGASDVELGIGLFVVGAIVFVGWEVIERRSRRSTGEDDGGSREN